MKNLKLRPRLQREFMKWYRENHHRFIIPLRLASISRRKMRFEFSGITPIVSAQLSNCGSFGIYVEIDDDECFDVLRWFDGDARRTDTGYYNTINLPEFQTIHPTRREFWRQEMFEPFLAWVNEELAAACWVLMSRMKKDSGTSWAKLIRNEDELRKPDETLLFIRSLVPLGGRKPEKENFEALSFPRNFVFQEIGYNAL